MHRTAELGAHAAALLPSAGAGRARWLKSSFRLRSFSSSARLSKSSGRQAVTARPRCTAGSSNQRLKYLNSSMLTLRLPTDGPRIADHVRDRVFVAGDVGPIIESVVEVPRRVGLLRQ